MSDGYRRGGVVTSPATADWMPAYLHPDECLLARRHGRWSCVRGHAEHDPTLCQHPTPTNITALCDQDEVWHCPACGLRWTEPRDDAPR